MSFRPFPKLVFGNGIKTFQSLFCLTLERIKALWQLPLIEHLFQRSTG